MLSNGRQRCFGVDGAESYRMKYRVEIILAHVGILMFLI